MVDGVQVMEAIEYGSREMATRFVWTPRCILRKGWQHNPLPEKG